MAQLTTKVGPKYQVTIPKDVRDELGLHVGDLVQARVGKGRTIIIERKGLVDFDAVLEEDLAAAEEDSKAGRTHGPFKTAEELAATVLQRPKRTARARHRAVKSQAHVRGYHA